MSAEIKEEIYTFTKKEMLNIVECSMELAVGEVVAKMMGLKMNDEKMFESLGKKMQKERTRISENILTNVIKIAAELD